MSGLALEVAVNRWLKPAFEAASPYRLDIDWRPTTAIMKSIAEGQRADVVIAIDGSMDKLCADRIVRSETRVCLADSVLGVGVREGAPKPDVSTPEALKRALVAAKSVGRASPAGGSITGGHIMRMFEKLGIADQIAPKTKLSMGGPNSRVSVLVSSGEAEIGLQQASELLDNPDVEMIGMLPPELQQITIYSAAITANAKQPEAATAMIDALTTPAAKSIFKAKGSGL